jgi:hypothetical protein
MTDVAISLPLAASTIPFGATIFIHAAGVRASLQFIRRAKQTRRWATSFWTDVAVVTAVIFQALVAHLVAIGVWAVLFLACGEFRSFAAAFDHSAVNYTTLGYGDVTMTHAWRLFGPLEAANGVLMFGLSTALIFAVIQNMLRTRVGSLD